ncbi:hypothetical protein NMG60_11009606, partial [Bertholletia excelsa]
FNDFGQTPIPKFIGSLTELRHLDLSFANFRGSIPSHLGNLSNLRHLNLANEHTNAKTLGWLSGLSFIQHLDMSYVDLSNASDWLATIMKLPSLPFLSLDSCQLSRNMPSPLSTTNSSISISTLDLSGNCIGSTIRHWLLHLSGALNMTSLSVLSLSRNQLEGALPKSLGKLCNLEMLYLSDDNFTGDVSEFFNNLSGCVEKQLEVLDLSTNHFTGLLPNLRRFSSLRNLYLDDNRLNGFAPGNLRNNSFEGVITEVHLANLTKLKNFSYIGISNCGISGTIPTWFWDLSPNLLELDVSHNQIRGKLPDLSAKFVEYPGIDLSFNELEGHVPPLPVNLSSLNLSNNKFCGTLSFIWSLNGEVLEYLDLSVNQFFEGIPDCWAPFRRLEILNVAHNGLSGMLPNAMGATTSLQTLNLNNNSILGRLPIFFQNYTQLLFVDLGMNQLSGEIPPWIGERLLRLRVLNLRSNKFYGTISSNLCYLQNICILDLSHNGITGIIPSCLSNLTAMFNKDYYFGSWYAYISYIADHQNSYGTNGYISQYVDSTILGWKGQEHEYTRNIRQLRVIDLSSNKLYGVLPEGITKLVGLVALNLSRNKLRGIISPNIGQLTLLESLDLSRNQFYGEIPATMVKLNFLSYLDLSYNRLSGRIPSSTQLQSFNASQYIGNAGLCGPPITLKCLGDEESKVKPISEEDQEDGEEFERWFYIGGAFGFVTGFWGVGGAILLKRSRRHAYFHFLDRSMNYLYVMMAVHMTKLLRKLRRYD